MRYGAFKYLDVCFWVWLQAGDSSHIPPDEEALQSIIAGEKDRDSFTTVVITGINPGHVPYIKQHFTEWTRQLAYV